MIILSRIRAGVLWSKLRLVFAVFFLHGAWPMPDDNETGYVIKAQHYWNPDTFKTDFFANSADAHLVYYWAFGWLTTLGWSLTTVAWIGRITTWLMLAISWRGLSWAIIRRPWIAVLSAELFLFLCERGQMAGEWIAGSVEAKGFAWAFVLWALTALVYRPMESGLVAGGDRHFATRRCWRLVGGLPRGVWLGFAGIVPH